jgi:hypothetical protein
MKRFRLATSDCMGEGATTANFDVQNFTTDTRHITRGAVAAPQVDAFGGKSWAIRM